jgi:hypothetical protein
MASLTGTKIKDTYDSLIKVSDNGALDGTLQTLTDGLGNNSALSLSTAGASVTGTLAVSGNATFDTTTLVVDAANNRVGVGTASPLATLTTENTGAVTFPSNDGDHTGFGLFIKAPSTVNTVNSAIGFGQTSGRKLAAIGLQTYADADQAGLNFYVQPTASGSSAALNEAMRIDSSGRVGIGTDAPDKSLVLRASTPEFKIISTAAQNSGQASALIAGSNSGSLFIYADAGNFATTSPYMSIGVSDVEAIRITDSGNVGIGPDGGTRLVITPTENSDVTLNVVDGASTSRNMIFSTGNTERMSIDSSGNVTIYGGGYLRVSPTTPPAVQIYRNANLGNNASAGILAFGGKDTSVFAEGASIGATTEGVWSTTSHPTRMYFATTPSGSATSVERMRIDSVGDLLINTTSTVGENKDKLVYSPNNSWVIQNHSTAKTSGSYYTLFYYGSTLIGSITQSGTTGVAYNTSSDYRLKEDWQPMEGALDRVDALKPVNFAWKSDGSRVDGFLAHELAEVVPEAVSGEKDATEIRSVEVSPAVYEDVIHPAEEAVYETIEHSAIAEELDEEGNVLVEAQEAWTEEVLVSEAKEEWVEKVLVSEAVFEDQEFPVYQGIDQSKIVPLLVAAIQELRAEIEALKALS